MLSSITHLKFENFAFIFSYMFPYVIYILCFLPTFYFEMKFDTLKHMFDIFSRFTFDLTKSLFRRPGKHRCTWRCTTLRCSRFWSYLRREMARSCAKAGFTVLCWKLSIFVRSWSPVSSRNTIPSFTNLDSLTLFLEDFAIFSKCFVSFGPDFGSISAVPRPYFVTES